MDESQSLSLGNYSIDSLELSEANEPATANGGKTKKTDLVIFKNKKCHSFADDLVSMTTKSN